MAHEFAPGTTAWDLNMLTGHCTAALKIYRENGNLQRVVDHLAQAAELADDLAGRIDAEDMPAPARKKGYTDTPMFSVPRDELRWVPDL